MQQLRLAFRLKRDERFVVTVERDSVASDDDSRISSQTTYDCEDRFLKLLIMADLDEDTTRRLVVAVVLSVARPKREAEWVPVEVNSEQCRALRLMLPEQRRSAPANSKKAFASEAPWTVVEGQTGQASTGG